MIKRPERLLVFVFFLALCYFPLFLHLDSLSLRLWDEGRRAVNAFEMTQDGNLLVPHYDGKPDMWGTKPPLLVWLQAGFMKLLGYNELAVRLPSALAGLATVLLMLWFARKQLGRPELGYFGGFILLTMPGYLMTTHSARTGDYDALLTLWLTGGLLSFYAYVHASDRREQNRFLWLTTACLVLGVLTKGVAGLFFLPGMAVYAIIQGEFRTIFRRKETYLAFASFLFFISAYYLLREKYNPGYLEAVWNNELGGWYIEGGEGHKYYPFHYYAENIFSTRAPFWTYLSLLGLGAGLFEKGKTGRMTLLLGVTSAIFLLVISNSKTKLAWYDLPVFPAMALLAATSLALIFRSGEQRLRFSRKPYRYVFYLLFFGFFFAYPYYRAIERVYREPDSGKPWQWEKMQYGNFMKRNPDLRQYGIGLNEYNPHVDFYLGVYNIKGYDLRKDYLSGRSRPGTLILTCDPVFREKLWSLYGGNLEPVRVEEPCVMWKVKESPDQEK